MTTYASFKPSVQFLADSIAGETTTTENVGRMHSSATFIGGTGTSESWYNGQKVSDQLASVDEAGLQEAKQIHKIISQGVRTWKDYNEYDPSNPRPTIRKIEEAVRNNDTKAVNRFKATPITTAEKIIHEETVNRLKDPNVSTGEKIVVGVIDAVAQTFNGAAKSVESTYIRIGDWTGWWDEMEPDVAEGSAYQGDLLTGITANDENVACSYVDKVTRPGYCEEMEKKYREGLLNADEQQNAQFDFDESGMDGLVAARSIEDIDWTTWCFEQQGPCKPLDAMALNEPQTNNVF